MSDDTNVIQIQPKKKRASSKKVVPKSEPKQPKGKPKGLSKTGGRQKGTPNKRTFDARKMAEDMGVDPLEILLKVAGNKWRDLGYDACFITKVNMGVEYEESVITMDNRINAAKEAAKYVYPQLKALELTGKDGANLFAQRLKIAQERVAESLVGGAVVEEINDDEFDPESIGEGEPSEGDD